MGAEPKTETLAKLWRRLWFPAAIVLLTLYNFPYFAAINSANELPRIYLTMAIYDRGAFDIEAELRRLPPTPDTSSYRGKRYSNKAPGQSLLTLPVYAVQKLAHGGQTPPLPRMFFWFRIFGAAVPALLFLLLLWRLLGEVVPELALRRFLLAGYALGTIALTYGTLFIAHQLSGVLVGTGFILIFFFARGRGGALTPLWAGLAAGAGVLVDYQVAFIGPPLFVYLLWASWRRLRELGPAAGQRRLWPILRPALVFCVGAALPLGFLLYYHWACFGSPLKTGYHYLTNPVFRQWHSQGFLGLSTPRLALLRDRLFSADDGLFWYSPFLLLCLPGLALMIRRRELRVEGIFCLLVVVFFLYFTASLVFVSGWDVGPRYITCALPYFLLPAAVAAVALSRRWYGRLPVYGLLAVSILIYLAVNAVFPHYPDNFSNPLFDVTYRFARAGYLPYNLGWLFGLTGLASAAPYAAVALALLGALLLGGPGPLRRRGAIAAGALCLVALLLSLYYAQLNDRRLPVPVKFLPWMERIWEPRHPGMELERLLPAGHPRTGGLKTIKP